MICPFSKSFLCHRPLTPEIYTKCKWSHTEVMLSKQSLTHSLQIYKRSVDKFQSQNCWIIIYAIPVSIYYLQSHMNLQRLQTISAQNCVTTHWSNLNGFWTTNAISKSQSIWNINHRNWSVWQLQILLMLQNVEWLQLFPKLIWLETNFKCTNPVYSN